MNKILFVIPTLFHNKELPVTCIESLKNNMKNFSVDYTIAIVINEMSTEFQNHDFGDNVIKLCSHLQFNIAKALNTARLHFLDYKYFCYIDEGMFVDNIEWIDYLIQLFEMNDNIGSVGCRPHSTFNQYNKKISDSPELYEVLWSDGILFTTKDILEKYNGFDEAYFGDCELQDFGYRLHFSGHKNLYWKSLFSKHKLIDYTQKSANTDVLIRLAWKSREFFKERWNNLEYQTYKFKSNPS